MADARQLGQRFVDAFNAHDEAAMRELNAENVVFEAPGDVRVEGKEAATAYALSWIQAFPDARLIVNNELADGNWVAQEITFEGTHENTMASPNGDIPATHKRLVGRAVQIFKVEGDVVVDTRLYYDQVQVMTQLGLMPEPAAATA
jgi:steroid delta-isomerase-like uncharacterized protein